MSDKDWKSHNFSRYKLSRGFCDVCFRYCNTPRFVFPLHGNNPFSLNPQSHGFAASGA